MSEKSLIGRGYGVSWIGEAWELYRLNPRQLVIGSLVTAVVTSALVWPLGKVSAPIDDGLFDAFQRGVMHPPSHVAPLGMVRSLAIAAAILAQIFIFAVGTLWQLRMGRLAMLQQPLTLNEIIGDWHQYRSMFVYQLAILLPDHIANFAVREIYPHGIPPDALSIIFLLSGIAFIVWVIFSALTYAGTVLVLDGAPPLPAMARSIKESCKHIGAVIAMIAVTALVFVFLLCVSGAISGLIFGSVYHDHGDQVNTAISEGAPGIMMAISALVDPLFSIIASLMARDILGSNSTQPEELA